MKIPTKISLLSILLALPLSGALAQELKPVGEARLQVMLWPIYHSRLLAPDGSYDPDVRPLRLEITYLREISADDLVDRTREEWEHLELEHPKQEQWLERLITLWPDVKDGDTLTLELDEANSRFYFNESPLGEMQDPEFGPQFLAIWLSPDTSRPKLREALLGIAAE